MPIREVLAAFEERGLKRITGGWIAKCGAHDDRQASLSIGEKDGGIVVLKCHAGCEVPAIVEAAGLDMRELFPAKDRPQEKRIVAEYDYRDEEGKLLYQAVRFEPKGFAQRKPGGPGGGWIWKLEDVRRVLYRLPQILEARDATVLIAEGEKDCDALAKLGFVATTNVGGAGKWKAEYSQSLRGRRVVILPDNDEAGTAHADVVARTLGGVAASVKILRLPGLPAKGDASDWIAAGGTADALLRLIFDAAQTAGPARFTVELGRKERAERMRDGANRLQFGVRYLDEAFCGITNTDIVLLGAKSGIGKTSLATTIALNNCLTGKRVHFFALEAEALEIERRMKYQIIADMYYADRDNIGHGLVRFPEWRLGLLDEALGRYEDEADRILEDRLSNLTIDYNLSQTFTAENFCSTIESLKGSVDMAVLDHVHFLRIEEKDENRGLKLAMQMIQRAAFEFRIPLLVVAHVRKGDRRYEPLVPTIEEFHGSSDVYKIATKAVMIAPAFTAKREAPYLCPTYLHAGKFRADGSITWYVAETIYNVKAGKYHETYTLGSLTNGGKEFAPTPWNEIPHWAKSSRNGELPPAEPDESDRKY